MSKPEYGIDLEIPCINTKVNTRCHLTTLVTFVSVMSVLCLSMTVPIVMATTGDLQGSMERLLQEIKDINSTAFESMLAIPNITQRDTPPVSTPAGSVVSTDEFAMNAEFEPHDNQYLADDNYWQMDAFGFNVSPNSAICPIGNCEFELEDGQINTDFRGDWVLTGRLKVGVETEEGTRSTLYDVRGELDRQGTLENEDTVTDILGGEFRLGSGSVILSQDIDAVYEITNGTVSIEDEDASLILRGIKQ